MRFTHWIKALMLTSALASLPALADDAAAAPGAGLRLEQGLWSIDAQHPPELKSAAFVLADQTSGQMLLERNADDVVPIASITKLMTAMVVLDGRQSLAEELTVTSADIDRLRGSRSRLPVGTRLSREEMLRLALMSSENRAASALARLYPGGINAFVKSMNVKARQMGLQDTRFVDSTGLDADNVSSARDMVRQVAKAARYPLIREFSTTEAHEVKVGHKFRRFGNTNGLVRNPEWRISLSKTGYIREAGRCLVMQAWMQGRPMIFVLLDSIGRYTRTADARRIKQWLESGAVELRAALGQESSG